MAAVVGGAVVLLLLTTTVEWTSSAPPPPAPPPPNPGPETLKLCQNPMVVKGRVSLNPQTLERRLLTLAAEYLSPKKLNLLKLQ